MIAISVPAVQKGLALQIQRPVDVAPSSRTDSRLRRTRASRRSRTRLFPHPSIAGWGQWTTASENSIDSHRNESPVVAIAQRAPPERAVCDEPDCREGRSGSRGCFQAIGCMPWSRIFRSRSRFFGSCAVICFVMARLLVEELTSPSTGWRRCRAARLRCGSPCHRERIGNLRPGTLLQPIELVEQPRRAVLYQPSRFCTSCERPRPAISPSRTCGPFGA